MDRNERNEKARELRRAAYQKAKEARANDPKYQALKEQMRQRQRAAYRAAKEKRKATAATAKPMTKKFAPPSPAVVATHSVDDPLTALQEQLLRLSSTRGQA